MAVAGLITAGIAAGDLREIDSGHAAFLVLRAIEGLVVPAVMGLLTRDRSVVQAGQWRRTITPILVQPSGFPALVFLLVGLAAVAPPLVGRFGVRPVVAGVVLAVLVPLAWQWWLDQGRRRTGAPASASPGA